MTLEMGSHTRQQGQARVASPLLLEADLLQMGLVHQLS